jgi:catechol 2,3-dioxygenase-like lactoylglutathione lyase family enzyme
MNDGISDRRSTAKPRFQAGPLLGIHHVRLPVTDLARSFAFFAELLGYERDFDFPGSADDPSGWALRHPEGGPNIVLWRNPKLAGATAGFPWFSIGLPSAQAISDLAAELDRRGIAHGGVQPAIVEVKQPSVHAPDGHLIGFYVIHRGDTVSEAPHHDPTGP